MRVLVTGASGFIGSSLVAFLASSGHAVWRLVRRPPRSGDEIGWDPGAGRLTAGDLEGFDAVVHLSGAPIAQRWTASSRRRIRDSRLIGTALLARALAALDRPPRVLVSASGIGIYGDRGDEWLDEGSAPGTGFLAELAVAWEAAADPARAAGIRVAHPRIGVVLDRRGGALARMLVPFGLGLGGPLGRGSAWWSWIALDDLLGSLAFAIGHDTMRGPFNAVAPAPSTNADFTRALARALRRPAPFRVPRAALRLLFGEMADEVLLSGQRARPARLIAAGFTFRHPSLEGALRRALEAR